MSLIKKLYAFLNRIFSYFKKNLARNEYKEKPLRIENLEERTIECSYKDISETENEDRINVAKRTIMTKLYMLEQEITVFENNFPKGYQSFMERIEMLREIYNSSLEEVKKLLTFEIDPELDSSKSAEVLKLEHDIKLFIEKEVKFDIISKRLQRLIVKLNILYNVSISHSKEYEKVKVVSQLEQALKSAVKVVREFKECDCILYDKQLKERIVSLISYVDYEIFKTSIRNSNKKPDIIIQNLVMTLEFDGFDYQSTFKAFIKDEISDLGELLPLVNDSECCKVLNKKMTNLLTKLTYSNDAVNQVFDIAFWNEFLYFESTLFEILKDSGVEEEKINVSLIKRMDIVVDKSEVFVLPKTNTHLSLSSIYSITHDEKVLLVIKLLKNLSNDVTYKEIYFLAVLFDVIGVIQNTPNELIRHIEKYINKYSYDYKTIKQKKESVINTPNKEYVVVFSLSNYEKDIVTALQNLNIDFKFENNNVFINSFYFKGLENVQKSLQANTNNMMI